MLAASHLAFEKQSQMVVDNGFGQVQSNRGQKSPVVVFWITEVVAPRKRKDLDVFRQMGK